MHKCIFIPRRSESENLRFGPNQIFMLRYTVEVNSGFTQNQIKFADTCHRNRRRVGFKWQNKKTT